MSQDDLYRVLAELDVLAEQVSDTIQRFEVTGFTNVMKDDYVALHALQHRIMQMRLEHSSAINGPGAGGVAKGKCH